jgi:hypothetical protein
MHKDNAIALRNLNIVSKMMSETAYTHNIIKKHLSPKKNFELGFL